MFDQSLVNKAVTDSRWRRDTALGRKVASKISLESIVKDPGDFIDWNDFDESRYCPLCGGFTTRSRVCKECLEECYDEDMNRVKPRLDAACQTILKCREYPHSTYMAVAKDVDLRFKTALGRKISASKDYKRWYENLSSNDLELW